MACLLRVAARGASLVRLFAPRSDESAEPAASFIRRCRRAIVNGVATWTGERKFDIDRLLSKLTRRCNVLGLYVTRGEAEMGLELGAFVTAVMQNIHRFREDQNGK